MLVLGSIFMLRKWVRVVLMCRWWWVVWDMVVFRDVDRLLYILLCVWCGFVLGGVRNL